MQNPFFCLMLFILIGLPAFAETEVSEDAQVVITRETCANIIKHAPVGVDYVPGVDARGNPVAPADLNAVALPEEFTVDASLFLDGAIDLPLPANSQRSGSELLDLKFNTATRQILLNGQPFGEISHDEIATLCREQYGDNLK